MNTVEPIKTLHYGQLPVAVYESEEGMGHAAATRATGIIQEALDARGEANVILATGNSQLAFLRALREAEGIDWSKVRVFHMDEYVGINPEHRASFPRFLYEHFLNFVSVREFFPISGEPDEVENICREYEEKLRDYPADMVALGWGENGHLAFNDPPYADFYDPSWVKVVELDDVSRRQQVGEGHFTSLEEVPKQAITLTIPALLAPKQILCIVPEARKADAVHACLTEPVSDNRPGTILREVTHAHLFLDTDSAAKL